MSSKVYFIEAAIKEGTYTVSQKARRLFKAANFADSFSPNDFTAVKVHVGEKGNTTHLPSGCIKSLVEELLIQKAKPFITDSNVLYIGSRHNAIDHSIVADEHGFGPKGLGAPFIVADGLSGSAETPVQIDAVLHKEVFIASAIAKAHAILSVAHLTGHCAAGLAATLKTLGMGCASKRGKMTQHAALTLSIGSNCQRCSDCFDICPAGAITLDDVKAHIDKEKCISCAECLAVCRFDAVNCDWGAESENFQKSLAEHALGVLTNKKGKSAFFNFALSITKDCDCFGDADMPKIAQDIGIFASADPVALDKATLDVLQERSTSTLPKLLGNTRLNPNHQLDHAQAIGLGTTDYELINVL